MLRPGRYWIGPGTDDATPQADISWRVLFTIPAGGWHSFLGAFKPEKGQGAGHRYVGVNFYDVQNVVRDGCEDHSPTNPPVGPSVEDLATAAAALPPFEVTSADVSAYGYPGKHLVLTVPEMDHEFAADRTLFTECEEGYLKSWVARPLSSAFWGYSGPGQVEELWILDVHGKRLVISALSHPESPAEDVSELRSVLDSIEIEP